MEYDLREIRKSKFLWKVYSAMVNHLSKRAVILTHQIKIKTLISFCQKNVILKLIKNWNLKTFIQLWQLYKRF